MGVVDILHSDKFDKDTFLKLKGFGYSYKEQEAVSDVTESLHKQYMEMDIEEIFLKHKEDEMIEFLNRLFRSQLEYKLRDKSKRAFVTLEELEECGEFVVQTIDVSTEELSKTAPLLTTRTYLEMCRLIYDATSEWKYPDDISTAFLFCENRMWSYSHEYEEGILGIDWDSPEQFASRFETSYHNEELWYGGPNYYIRDEGARIRENVYTGPGAYSQWVGHINCCIYDDRSIKRAIRMYNVLRRNGYPVYFSNIKEVYPAVLKRLNHKFND